jgi:uncharacterized protein YegL
MPETQVENIVFILDASRSMYRRDYNPNRLEAAKEAILSFIRARRAEDAKSSFSLVIFGKEIKEIIKLSDYSDEDVFRSYFEEITPAGNSKISDAIGIAIKIHIEDIRVVGAKVPKIILISDGKLTNSKVTPTKMAQIANGLEIRIDTIRLGEVEHFNIMKRISELSDGRYFYCNDAANVSLSGRELGESNKGKKYQKSKNFTTILEKIAVPLKTISELNQEAEDVVARIRGTASFKKCGICFAEEDPITKAPFSIAGRYCPNCGKGYHIHCMSQWANNDKDSNGRVTRCPHCFYLIKIPSDVQQVTKIRDDIKRERESYSTDTTGPAQFFAKTYTAIDLGDSAIYSACPVCNSIFEEDEKVVKCGNPECNAIYHMDCFESYDGKPCKTCGQKMSRSF